MIHNNFAQFHWKLSKLRFAQINISCIKMIFLLETIQISIGIWTGKGYCSIVAWIKSGYWPFTGVGYWSLLYSTSTWSWCMLFVIGNSIQCKVRALLTYYSIYFVWFNFKKLIAKLDSVLMTAVSSIFKLYISFRLFNWIGIHICGNSIVKKILW